MDKTKLKSCGDLFQKKFKDLWDELGDEINGPRTSRKSASRWNFSKQNKIVFFKNMAKPSFYPSTVSALRSPAARN